MTEIIRNLDSISQKYNVILCDLWGCLHDGKKTFPKALNAIKKSKYQGNKIILLTNSPRTKKFVRKQISQIGILDNLYDDIVTSGDASLSVVEKKILGNKIFHIGPKRDISFFSELKNQKEIERVDLNCATGIVCTGLFDEINENPNDYFEILNFSFKKKLKFLCVNPDIEVNFGNKKLWCAGSLAQLYLKMGGDVIFCGKPHQKIYNLAIEKISKKFNIFEKKILCIGDGLNTDIMGGINQGYDTLFVCSGIHNNQIGITNLSPKPEVKKLKKLFNERNLSPTMAIGYLH